MYSPREIVLCCLLLVIASVCVDCELEVQLLHVVFRHGDKVPHKEFQNYPNDPHRNHSYYPMGNGDLTNQGKMREYKIGAMLRERYDKFLGEHYWPEKIYARSTDVPRTQLSLQLVLAGLYPPSEKQTWNPRLPWIPVSTFSVPYLEDNLLFPHYCPRYVEEYAKFLRVDSTRELVEKYKNVMSYLTDHTGKIVNTTSSVSYLFNLLKEEAAQNLTLPKWTENVYPNPMTEIIALDFKLRSYTKTLRRLNGGMLLRKVVDTIEEFRAGTLQPKERIAFLFGAHELNVAAFARAMGSEEPAVPAYGSAIVFETLRDKKGNYFVRPLLWTGVTEELKTITIPGCSTVCPMELFLELVKDVIPNNEEYFCRRFKPSEEEQRNGQVHSAATGLATDGIFYSILMVLSFLFHFLR